MRTITRATSRPGLASALIVALALASCGGSDDKPASIAATSVATTAKAPPAPAAPDGHLSAAEYESMRKLTKRFDKLGHVRPPAAAGVRSLRSACRGLAAAPQTDLMVAERSMCNQAVRLLGVIARFSSEKERRECNRAAQVGDVSCFAQVYRSLAGSARVTAVRGEEVNAAARDRHLSAVCVLGVGFTKRGLDSYRVVARHARGAALALEAKDQARLNRALAAINADFKAGGVQSAAATLRQLRACRA